MKLTEFISDVGRPVAYYPGLKKITKSTTATILLCQLIYWTGKQADPEGWIYKTSDDLEEETGLTYDEQKTARTQLVKLGLIEEVYRRLDHQMAFRIMANAINENWRTGEYGIPQSGVTALGKVASPDSLTETTAQTTAKNTTVIIDDSPAFDANPLSSAFVKASGIMPYSLDKWLKSIEELAKMGAAPDDVTKAVANLPSRYKIAGPWSIQNAVAIVMAERSKKERAEDKRPPEVGNLAPVFNDTKSATRQKSQFEKEYGL